MKVHVLDAMCGSGKSTRLIEMISKMPANARVIYITPLLSECHRVAGTSPTSDEDASPMLMDDYEYLYDDKAVLYNRRFRHPTTARSKHGTKMNDFKHLVANGCNIVSTHSLFSQITKEIVELIYDEGYILILDEVLSMYEQYDGLDNATLQSCFKNGWMYLDEDKITLCWNHQHVYDDIFELDEIGRLCDNKQLLLIDGKAVMIEFPAYILKCFKEIYIATYMFEGSQMCPYLKLNDIECTVERFGLKPSSIKHLVNLVLDDKMNSIGDGNATFSKSSLSNMKSPSHVPLNVIYAKLHNFMKNRCDSKTNDRLWTTFKSSVRGISKGRYNKSWLACNTKATNDYRHTWAVAYLLNLYPNPMLMKLLCYREVGINREQYALSEMVQFIWRSRIRDGQPIDLYIPSSRMRNLLIQWMNDEFELES